MRDRDTSTLHCIDIIRICADILTSEPLTRMNYGYMKAFNWNKKRLGSAIQRYGGCAGDEFGDGESCRGGGTCVEGEFRAMAFCQSDRGRTYLLGLTPIAWSCPSAPARPEWVVRGLLID